MNEAFGHIPADPSGHIPGIHLPGTLIRIGAVMQQQQAAQDQAEADARKRRRRNILLLLNS